MTHQNLRLGKYWKLFHATLNFVKYRPWEMKPYHVGKKFKWRVKKGSVKIWKLDSNNRNGDWDIFDESDNYWWIIRLIEAHYTFHAQLFRHAFFRLFSLLSHFSLFWCSYPFSSSPFHQTRFKKNQAKEKSSLCLWCTLIALQNTRVFLRFVRKFHQEVNGSKLSLYWLAQLS